MAKLKDNSSKNLSAFAKASMIRVSPRKLGLVIDLIRRMKVSEALIQLTFSKKRIAGEVKKCLQSAISNAEHNFALDVDNLYITEALIGKALVMKRMMPRAKGRGVGIKKFFSNLKITVSEIEG